MEEGPFTWTVLLRSSRVRAMGQRKSSMFYWCFVAAVPNADAMMQVQRNSMF